MILFHSSLEGIVDKLRSDRLVDGIAVDNIQTSENTLKFKINKLPGVGGNQKAISQLSTNTKLVKNEIMTYALQFSITGREFAVVSTEGLQIYSLDNYNQYSFVPMELDISITPNNVEKLYRSGNFVQSIQMALLLNDFKLLAEILEKIPISAVEIIIKAFDQRLIKDFIIFLSQRLVSY